MASNPKLPSGNETSGQKLEGIAAPYVARLFNQHGPVDRRKILQVASGGIIGTILGGSAVNAGGFFSRLWDLRTPPLGRPSRLMGPRPISWSWAITSG
jgi:hypothetical protein